MFHDPDFSPFTPRTKPSIPVSFRNFLENWPPDAYRSGWTTMRGYWPLVPNSHLLADPRLIEEILITRADEFDRDFMSKRALAGPINEGSLFFADGADWKWQRRAIAPAFRHENLLALVPDFVACARDRAEIWRKSGNNVDDVMQDMSRTAFAVIERATLGAPDRLDRERFLDALTPNLQSIGWRRMLVFFGAPDWVPYPGERAAADAQNILQDETLKLIAARRAGGGGGGGRDMLALLLEAQDPETGRRMNDTELLGNLYSLLVAGHETSAVALGWALWLLAKDEASQERLRREVAEVTGDADIGADTVENLQFTKQVLMEAMRLFPPAPAIGRQPRRDTTLGGRKVSRKEPFYVAIWCLHRHEKLWDQPNAFDPDRFAPEKIKARPRCAFLPFGAGPRICVGMSFAMLEMTAILATLVRGFRFSTVAGHRLELQPDFTVRPKGPLPLRIEPVDAKVAAAA